MECLYDEYDETLVKCRSRPTYARLVTGTFQNKANEKFHLFVFAEFNNLGKVCEIKAHTRQNIFFLVKCHPLFHQVDSHKFI